MKRLEPRDRHPEHLRSLEELAGVLGLPWDGILPRGRGMGKVDLQVLGELQERRPGKLILVTAMTPTPFGEGKTITTIGLAMALETLGYRSACTLREPSMGPLFGVKGGGTGGGKACLVPSDEINLHFTGDFHAVAMAHNLLAAAADQALFRGEVEGLEPEGVTWKRVVDLNDRALRYVDVRPDGRRKGGIRSTGFDITAASEVMAVLALSRDFADLRRRLGRIVIGKDRRGRPVTAEELGAAGAMAALVRDALLPNLVQTSSGTPAFVHTGPFANIAHGSSSILADQVALHGADFVVTEAGFGAEMGAEKFFHIKCRAGGTRPSVVVLVASVRALKYHSGRFEIRPGAPLPPEILREDLDALEKGEPNLEKQTANASSFGAPVVVAINRFPTDTDAEVDCLKEMALSAGAEAVVESTPFQRGSLGGADLARACVEVLLEEEPRELDFLFPGGAPVKEKVESLAREFYGAARVDWAPRALEDLDWLNREGYGNLPVCVAKTQFSLSHDPALKGAPRGYAFPVRELRLAAGAGFVLVLAGSILTMPGFPPRPAFKRLDLGPDGSLLGLG